MRRFRGSRRGTRKHRQLHWISSHIAHDFTDGLNSASVITAWSKWPAGFPDTSTVELRDEETDETVVRTIWSPYMTVQGPDAATSIDNIIVGAFGLIAWDTTDPDELHLQVNVPGIVPDPYYGQYDWMLRKVYCFCPGSGVLGVGGISTMFSFPTTDVDSSSKAKRKMPPGTGVLQVVSARILIGTGGTIYGQMCNDVRLGVLKP